MRRRGLLNLGLGGLAAWLTDAPADRSASTGASPRGLPQRPDPLGAISVRAYGAAGDGCADETAALQAALDAADARGGGAVTLEPGDYAHSGTLTLPARVHLFGFSNYRYDFSTRLHYTGRRTAIRVAGDHAGLTGISVFTASGATGVDTDGRIGLTVRDCNIQGFSRQALLCAGSFWVRLYRVHIQGGLAGGNGIVATQSFNQNVIDTCGFTCAHGQRWTAIDIGTLGDLTSTGSSVVNSDFSGGWGSAPLIRVRSGTHGLWIAGNRMESAGASFLRQEKGAFGVTVVGNYIAGSTSLPAVSGIEIEGSDTVVLGNTFGDVLVGARIDESAERVLVDNNAFLPSVPAAARVGSARSSGASGQRSWLPGHTQGGTVAAAQREVPLLDAIGAARGRLMPRPGSVTGLAINLRHARTGGALAVEVQRSSDGGQSYAPVSGAHIMLDTATHGARATFAPGACPFAAGDLLRLAISTSAEWGPTANELDAVVEVEA